MLPRQFLAVRHLVFTCRYASSSKTTNKYVQKEPQEQSGDGGGETTDVKPPKRDREREGKEDKELRKRILDEYEWRRQSKIKRYLNALSSMSIDREFVTEHMLHYPLLSFEESANITGGSNDENMTEFERKARSALYQKKEYEALKRHLFVEQRSQHVPVDAKKIYANTPAVTNVIEIAQPMPVALLEWQFQKIKVLGDEGFAKYKRDLVEVGKAFHSYLADRLEAKKDGRIDDVDIGKIKGVLNKSQLKQLNQVLNRIGKVILIEADCSHENLFYKGRIDCLAYFDNELYLIDWKVNEHRKETVGDLYDTPMQLAAYLGAYLNDSRHAQLRSEHRIKGGLFVNICRTTGDVNLHFINYHLAEYFWYKWLAYLRKFWSILLRENI